VFWEFDGVLVDGERGIQEIGTVGDILFDGNFLNGGDFLDHYLGESFGLTDSRELVLTCTLLLLTRFLVETEVGLVVFVVLP